MTAPKRDPRTLLATGGLLLIPLAALWLLASPHPARQGVGAAGPADRGTLTGVPEEPALPAARLVAGAPAQAEWTLLGVTRLVQRGTATPPPSLAPPGGASAPPPVGMRTGGPSLASATLTPSVPTPRVGAPAPPRNTFVMSAGAGTGLWIGVRGGLGVKTLTVPQDGRPHSYPLGRAVFVVQASDPGSYQSTGETYRWTAPDGAPLSGVSPPYQMWPDPVAAAPGGPALQTVTLAPSTLSDRFRVTAQPLSADGKAFGKAVSLLCQPVTAAALFAQIPVGYSTKTQQFQVTIARVGDKTKNGSASWRITDLPPSAGNGPDGLPPAPSARFGPFVLNAVAAEADDTSGLTDFLNRRPDRPGTGPPSQNMDGHQWTGIPTLRYLLTARRLSPVPPGQSWTLQVDRATPQWVAPRPPLRPSATTFPDPLPDFFPLGSTHALFSDQDAAQGQVLQDGEAGAAYPGQQRWIKIDGVGLRSATRTETLTFHDADVVHDAGFGGDRLVWQHPETETTPSGISVTVLNGLPGKRGPGVPQIGGPDWWYDRGNAELLLAWRLPHGMVAGPRASPALPRVAEPPQGGGPLRVVWDTTHPIPYSRWSVLPGAADGKPLIRAGYSLLRFSVWMPQTPKRTPAPLAFLPGRPPTPETLPPYSWREGSDVLSAAPLPRHFKTLTLQISLREEQERRPLHFVVPVRPFLPPGAYLNARRAAPARSQTFSFIQAPTLVEQSAPPPVRSAAAPKSTKR